MKYNELRSRNMSEVIGQDHIVKPLLKKGLTGQIGHSMLFVGKQGVGKTSIARLISRLVNCEDPGEDGACNKCSSCQSILNNETMDVVEIDASSNNGVDYVRDLNDKCQQMPLLNYKVYIIDEVHGLSSHAFRALLKLLEEPPAHCIFILCTTESDKIPLTIISRCEEYEFRAIAKNKIAGRVRYALDKYKFNYDDEVPEIIAGKAKGSMRNALSTLDMVAVDNNEKLTKEYVLMILGNDEADAISLVESVINKDLKKALDNLDTFTDNGGSLVDLINNMISILCKAAVAIFSTEELEEEDGDDKAIYKNIISNIEFDELKIIIGEFKELKIKTSSNIYPYTELMATIAHTCLKVDHNTVFKKKLDNIMLRIENLENKKSLDIEPDHTHTQTISSEHDIQDVEYIEEAESLASGGMEGENPVEDESIEETVQETVQETKNGSSDDPEANQEGGEQPLNQPQEDEIKGGQVNLGSIRSNSVLSRLRGFARPSR